MRRSILFALAVLSACTAFGKAEDPPPETTLPDGGTVMSNPDGSASTDADPSTPSIAACSAVVPKPTLCIDFDGSGLEVPGLIPPTTGASFFSQKVDKAPADDAHLRGQALRVQVTGTQHNFGSNDGGFRLELDYPNLKTATLDLDVLVEASNYNFARFAGFEYADPSDLASLAFTISGHDAAKGTGDFVFDGEAPGDPPRLPATLGSWHHARITLAHVPGTIAAMLTVDNTVVHNETLVVKPSGGSLVLTFGLYDTSEDDATNLIVWLDNIVLATQ